jgi:hypothetical protein
LLISLVRISTSPGTAKASVSGCTLPGILSSFCGASSCRPRDRHHRQHHHHRDDHREDRDEVSIVNIIITSTTAAIIIILMMMDRPPD